MVSSIFESEYYSKIMSIAIVVTSLLLVFSLVNITNQANKLKLTGYAVESTNTYSLNSHYIIYMVSMILVVFISIVLLNFMSELKKKKNQTEEESSYF
jgi:hypothetical protein